LGHVTDSVFFRELSAFVSLAIHSATGPSVLITGSRTRPIIRLRWAANRQEALVR